jgi:hypothetical protein
MIVAGTNIILSLRPSNCIPCTGKAYGKRMSDNMTRPVISEYQP